MSRHYTCLLLCAILLWCVPVKPVVLATSTTKSADKEKLERAIQYFQGGKFHEALLLFAPLSKKYTLSKRTIAYMGVCCYYEGDFEMAANCFAQSAEDIEYFDKEYIQALELLFNIAGLKKQINYCPT